VSAPSTFPGSTSSFSFSTISMRQPEGLDLEVYLGELASAGQFRAPRVSLFSPHSPLRTYARGGLTSRSLVRASPSSGVRSSLPFGPSAHLPPSSFYSFLKDEVPLTHMSTAVVPRPLFFGERRPVSRSGFFSSPFPLAFLRCAFFFPPVFFWISRGRPRFFWPRTFHSLLPLSFLTFSSRA